MPEIAQYSPYRLLLNVLCLLPKGLVSIINLNKTRRMLPGSDFVMPISSSEVLIVYTKPQQN